MTSLSLSAASLRTGCQPVFLEATGFRNVGRGLAASASFFFFSAASAFFLSAASAASFALASFSAASFALASAASRSFFAASSFFCRSASRSAMTRFSSSSILSLTSFVCTFIMKPNPSFDDD